MFIDDTKKKLSLGFLRRANKTKLRSPDWTGTLNLQRDTLNIIVQQLEDSGGDDVVCCIAAWEKQDKNGEPFATVQLSPKFVSRQAQVPQESPLASFSDNPGDLE